MNGQSSVTCWNAPDCASTQQQLQGKAAKCHHYLTSRLHNANTLNGHKNTFLRSNRAISTGLQGCNRQVVEVLKVFNDHPGGMIVSSSWTGTENLATCNRFGAEGSPLNNSRKVSESIGMVTEARLTILVVGGFFIFSFSAISTAKSAASQDCLNVARGRLVSSVRWCYLRPPSYRISSHNRASEQETERGHGHLYACPGLWRLRKT